MNHVVRTYMRIPSISLFQRSAIARSCSAACEMLRLHIFADGSSPPGKLGAAPVDKIKSKIKRTWQLHMDMNTHVLPPFLSPHLERQTSRDS